MQSVFLDHLRASFGITGVRGIEPVARRVHFQPQDRGEPGALQVELHLGNERSDRVHFVWIEPEYLPDFFGEIRVCQEHLGGHGFEQPGRAGRIGHIPGALCRHDEGGVFLPPGLRRLDEIGQHGGIFEVAPRLVHDHELDARNISGVFQGNPQAFEQVEHGGFAQVFMFGGPGQVDHLPVGKFQIIAIGWVVEIFGPGARAVPASHRGPHALGQGSDKRAEVAPCRWKGVEIFDAIANFGGIVTGGFYAPEPKQSSDPSGKELKRAFAGSETERPQPEGISRSGVIGRQFQVAPAEETW